MSFLKVVSYIAGVFVAASVGTDIGPEIRIPIAIFATVITGLGYFVKWLKEVRDHVEESFIILDSIV